MDSKLLEKIGLTSGEVKVYLALLRLGSSKTGVLASKAGVSSSKVYKILDRLEKKGLVGHVLKGEIKHFNAMSPKRLLDYIDEEEDRLRLNKDLINQVLPELEKEQNLASSKTEAAVYSGFKAVTNFIRNILDELDSGDSYTVIGAGYGEVPGLRAFFRAHHLRRSKKNVFLTMLANYDIKDRLEESTLLNSQIRYLPQYLITNTTIYFYKNKVFIAIFTKEPTGFLLENAEAVKSFKNYFDVLWKIAKN